ncbi:hypothetical protein FRC08_009002 [Ceratobasidium sp. 394]|nr:hypothetical protein FRC08_009002 [Ceratobasidium sp. 394]KAG9101796.1 hypothetical protein FS749_003099 [Ceratobasidium sp. UAMH 11750]
MGFLGRMPKRKTEATGHLGGASTKMSDETRAKLLKRFEEQEEATVEPVAGVAKKRPCPSDDEEERNVRAKDSP